MKKSILLVLLIIVFSSCYRKELLEPHLHYNAYLEANLISNVELDSLPKTVFYHLYQKDGTFKISGEVEGLSGRLALPTGIYDMLIYTSDFYYDNPIKYRDLYKVHSAEAHTPQTQLTPQSYQIEEPDPLYSVLLKDITIQEIDKDKLIKADLLQRSYLYYLYINVTGLNLVSSA